jgi:hypothetical protein
MKRLRTLVWAPLLVFAGVMLIAGSHLPVVFGQTATPEAAASAPDWRFIVHGIQDPYAGVLPNPSESSRGLRYVAFDVEVINDSDQPLTYGANAISLRDQEGFSYRSGTVTGGEPALPARTLMSGERARGWVWFGVRENAQLRQIVLIPSAPELAVDVAAAPAIAATPRETAAAQSPAPEATTAPAQPASVITVAESPAATAAAPTPTPRPGAESVILIATESPGGASPSPTPTAGTAPAPAARPATETPLITIETEATATPAPQATTAATAGAFAPGEAVTNGAEDTNLRDGPGLDTGVIATLPLGTDLTITGPPVTADGFVWWPVEVAGSGETGYVAEELLTPAGG